MSSELSVLVQCFFVRNVHHHLYACTIVTSGEPQRLRLPPVLHARDSDTQQSACGGCIRVRRRMIDFVFG